MPLKGASSTPGQAGEATTAVPVAVKLRPLEIARPSEAIEDGTFKGLTGGAVDAEEEVLLRACLVEAADEDWDRSRRPG